MSRKLYYFPRRFKCNNIYRCLLVQFGRIRMHLMHLMFWKIIWCTYLFWYFLIPSNLFVFLSKFYIIDEIHIFLWWYFFSSFFCVCDFFFFTFKTIIFCTKFEVDNNIKNWSKIVREKSEKTKYTNSSIWTYYIYSFIMNKRKCIWQPIYSLI